MPSPPKHDRLCVVLVATRNPLNIGAAARAMSNFGFSHLRVVNPYELAFREARSAVGASELLKNAKEYKSVAEAVADCALVVGTTAVHNRDLQHPLKHLEDGTRLIRKRLATAKVALLFGSEKRGLSNQDLSHCHWLMHIPTQEEHLSMNLAQAVAICLYELVRAKKNQKQRKKSAAARNAKTQEPSTTAQMERITTILLDALSVSGYLRLTPTPLGEEKIRRLVRRLNVPAGDAEIWLGILRQMVWKMRSEEEAQKRKEH